jgi:anti-sigma factor RsiW
MEGNQMQCSDFQEIADSYLSDELLIETNHDVIRHLDACAACRFELAARRELRYEIRREFNQASELRIPDGFSKNLRAQLKERALERPAIVIPRVAYVGIAAALLVAVGFGLLAVQRWRIGQRELAAWASLTNGATGDHRECALEHKLTTTVITLTEAGQVYDRAFANVADQASLQRSLPSGAHLLDAHSCAFAGQRFAHLVLKYHDQVVSIVIARNDANAKAPTARAGDTAAAFTSDSYQVAALQTTNHAVFVISSLNENDNMTIARAVSPLLEKQIRSAEEPLQATLFNVRRR